MIENYQIIDLNIRFSVHVWTLNHSFAISIILTARGISVTLGWVTFLSQTITTCQLYAFRAIDRCILKLDVLTSNIDRRISLSHSRSLSLSLGETTVNPQNKSPRDKLRRETWSCLMAVKRRDIFVNIYSRARIFYIPCILLVVDEDRRDSLLILYKSVAIFVSNLSKNTSWHEINQALLR